MTKLERQMQSLEPLLEPFKRIMDGILDAGEKDREDLAIAFMAAMFLALAEHLGPDETLVCIGQAVRTVPEAARLSEEWAKADEGTEH